MVWMLFQQQKQKAFSTINTPQSAEPIKGLETWVKISFLLISLVQTVWMNKTGVTDDGAMKLHQICVSNKHQHSLMFKFENHNFFLTVQLLDEDKVKLFWDFWMKTLWCEWSWEETSSYNSLKGIQEQCQRFRYCLEAEYSCAGLSVIMWQRNFNMNPSDPNTEAAARPSHRIFGWKEKTQSFGCSRQKHWDQGWFYIWDPQTSCCFQLLDKLGCGSKDPSPSEASDWKLSRSPTISWSKN